MAESQPILAHAAPQVLIPPRKYKLIRSSRSNCAWKEWVQYAYFVEAAGSGRVKIGLSLDVGRRINNLEKSAASPFPLEFRGAVLASQFSEHELHKRFSEYRVYKEWFVFSDAIRQFLATHALTTKAIKVPSNAPRGLTPDESGTANVNQHIDESLTA